MKKWEDLPVEMQLPEVREYYDVLNKKKGSLFLKRVFDIMVSSVLLVILSPVILLLSMAIKLDSGGPVFYKKGSLVTVGNDERVTRVGKVVRKCRLDEIAQLIDVFKGDMTFVGVRPEVGKYVEKYEKEWLATFLLPAGVTNLTCIYFKDEDEMLAGVDDVDREYIEKILPIKMKWNLKGIKEFAFWNDIRLMFMTFFTVCGKEYREE